MEGTREGSRPAAGVLRWLWLALAGLSFVLAVLGAFLPGLPTTPFLLVTSYCLVRSSPALHQKLLANRLFGGLLRDWERHRGIRPHVRLTALTVMGCVAAVNFAAGDFSPVMRGILLALVLVGTIVVLRLPSIRD